MGEDKPVECPPLGYPFNCIRINDQLIYPHKLDKFFYGLQIEIDFKTNIFLNYIYRFCIVRTNRYLPSI